MSEPEGAPEVQTEVPEPSELFVEVCRGLDGTPRSLPSKLFYDERGAELFERITELEDYYPTQTEIRILQDHATEVSELVGPRARVVEYGSGSGDKTWILLEHLEDPVAYVPVDVAREQLAEFAERVNRRFPGMEVLPVAADYTRLDELPAPRRVPRTTLAFFPGSTVGNLEPDEAVEFLRQIGQMAGPDSLLLIGVDLVKDPAVLERAYNDREGVTAEFNRNILRHVNRLLDGDFDVDAFRHRAIWNPRASRIEMHLVSGKEAEVSLRAGPGGPERAFRLRDGEVIVTEHCYKYTVPDFQGLAARAGYRPVKAWTDDAERFSVHLLRYG
jgi:dimethylhistidine N-methyltransferase